MKNVASSCVHLEEITQQVQSTFEIVVIYFQNRVTTSAVRKSLLLIRFGMLISNSGSFAAVDGGRTKRRKNQERDLYEVEFWFHQPSLNTRLLVLKSVRHISHRVDICDDPGDTNINKESQLS